ncbi:Flocculation protein FLO9 [Pichia kudriavzevii]|uniref:Flocculation protein FLO9 n=1 Tax=Pichia kudriavzevii TaxID=4909 RepID=A0A1V2LFI5_PICKU|nr:Flocculation protein FLO9 [Pichia kudriavzevii]
MNLSAFTSLIIALSMIANAEVLTSIVGCNFQEISSSQGFNAVAFQYDTPMTTAFSKSAFYESEYKAGDTVGTATDITEINFSLPGGEQSLYGLNIRDTSNYALEYTGYFKAAKSGIYKFDMTKVDDGAMVFIGNSAYDCCQPGSIPFGKADEAAMFSYKEWNTPSSESISWVYLEAHSYYPIKIVYVNVISAGGIELLVTPPDSETVNVGEMVFQLVNDPQNVCEVQTFVTEYSSATTFIYSDVSPTTKFVPSTTVIDGYTTTVIEKQIYYSEAASTIVSYVFGNTAYTSTYRSTMVINTETIPVDVEIIGSPNYFISTIQGTRHKTITRTSDFVQTLNGETTTSSIIIIELPVLKTKTIQSDVQAAFTSTVESVKNVHGVAQTTSEVLLVIPSLVTYSSFIDGKKTSVETKTTVFTVDDKEETVTGCFVGIPRKHSRSYWDYGYTSYYTSTYLTTVTGKVQSTELIVENAPSVSYTTIVGVYDRETKITETQTTVRDGNTATFIAVTVVKPAKTVLSTGVVPTQYLTTNKSVYYVVVETNVPTFTSYCDSKRSMYTTYKAVVNGESTGWNYIVYIPSPTTQVSQWTETYSTAITSTLYYQNTKVTGFQVIEYVPNVLTSVSTWTGASTKVITEVGYSTNSLNVVNKSTMKVVYVPSLSDSTTTWNKPDTSTSMVTTTITGPDNFPITTTEKIVSTTVTKTGPNDVVTKSINIVVKSIDSTCLNSSGFPRKSTIFTGSTLQTTNTITTEAFNCIPTTILTTTTITGSDLLVTKSADIIIATPKTNCHKTNSKEFSKSSLTTSSFLSSSTAVLSTITSAVTNYYQASDCRFETSVSILSAVTGNDFTVTEIEELSIVTPMSTCGVYFRTDQGFGCSSTMYTTAIGTTNYEGQYVNATLVIFETPGAACFSLTSYQSQLTIKPSNSMIPATSGTLETTMTLGSSEKSSATLTNAELPSRDSLKSMVFVSTYTTTQTNISSEKRDVPSNINTTGSYSNPSDEVETDYSTVEITVPCTTIRSLVSSSTTSTTESASKASSIPLTTNVREKSSTSVLSSTVSFSNPGTSSNYDHKETSSNSYDSSLISESTTLLPSSLSMPNALTKETAGVTHSAELKYSTSDNVFPTPKNTGIPEHSLSSVYPTSSGVVRHPGQLNVTTSTVTATFSVTSTVEQKIHSSTNLGSSSVSATPTYWSESITYEGIAVAPELSIPLKFLLSFIVLFV